MKEPIEDNQVTRIVSLIEIMKSRKNNLKEEKITWKILMAFHHLKETMTKFKGKPTKTTTLTTTAKETKTATAN
jgi:hypothetical protein